PASEAELPLPVSHVSALRAEVDEIDASLATPGKDSEKHAKTLRTTLVPAMERARAASDALEARIPAELWPLPTYAEMLLVGR
ncbi:MAG TPA: glutamine synthetase type III, partial [Phycisphaerales bacterium]|nr:glutamine synthetase type III [Phycisphaerales bacterium]